MRRAAACSPLCGGPFRLHAESSPLLAKLTSRAAVAGTPKVIAPVTNSMTTMTSHLLAVPAPLLPPADAEGLPMKLGSAEAGHHEGDPQEYPQIRASSSSATGSGPTSPARPVQPDQSSSAGSGAASSGAAASGRRGRGGRLRVAAVDCPLIGEDGHDDGVDALTVPPQGVPQDALGDEADLLVRPLGAGIEGVHLKRDPVQAELLEAVADDQPGRFCAQSVPVRSWR